LSRQRLIILGRPVASIGKKSPTFQRLSVSVIPHMVGKNQQTSQQAKKGLSLAEAQDVVPC